MSKEKLIAARELIMKKQYDEARAILQTVNHPVAEQWLQKLDALIQKQNASPAKTPTVAVASMPDSRHRRINPLQQDMLNRPEPTIFSQPEMVQPPAGDPWDPSWIFSMSFVGTIFFASIGLSLNWRRLGKPSWMWWSFLFLAIMPILAIVGMFGLLFASDEMGTFEIIGVALFLIVIVFAWYLNYVVQRLQSAPYKKWYVDGDVEGMLHYPYNFRRAFLRGILEVCVLAIVVGGFVYMVAPKQAVFAGKGVYLEYLDLWHNKDIRDNENCKSLDVDCVFFMTLGQFEYTTATLYRIQLDDYWDLDEYEQYQWEYLTEQVANIERVSSESLVINGQNARATTFSYPAVLGEYDSGYEMAIYFIVDQTAYVLGIYSPNRGIFRENFEKIKDFYQAIEFTGDSNIIWWFVAPRAV